MEIGHQCSNYDIIIKNVGNIETHIWESLRLYVWSAAALYTLNQESGPLEIKYLFQISFKMLIMWDNEMGAVSNAF